MISTYRLLPNDPSARRLSGSLVIFLGTPKSQGINFAYIGLAKLSIQRYNATESASRIDQTTAVATDE